MSRNLGPPILTPSSFIAGKEQIVIVEFDGVLPQSSLVTFNFYCDGMKVSTVPIVLLGPHTAKAKFPEFSKNGEVEVIVHINREESPAIPRFRFRVMSQLEAMFAPVAGQESNKIALLASALAYLTHCNEKDRLLCAQADAYLSSLLQQFHTFELSDWSLGALFSGKYGSNDNLLHFCTRRNLSVTTEHLLLYMPNSKKYEYMHQRSSDSKTPIELAQKNDMKRIVEIAEQMMTQASSTGKKSKEKKKKGKVEKSRSIDSQINHLCIPGSPDINKSATFSQSPDHKRKENKGSKLKKHFRKEKGVSVVSNPHHPYINEYGEPMIAPADPGTLSPPLTPSRSMDRMATWSESIPKDPFSISSHGANSPVTPSSPLLQTRHEIPIRSTVTVPRNFRPASRTESVGSSSSSFDQGEPQRLMQVRPVSSSLSGASDQGNAVSMAIRELKSKALYVAEVVQEYNWTIFAQGESNCILEIGHRVFVTQNGVDGDQNLCLGVWNGRYGKLPLSILRPLPSQTECSRVEIDEGNSSEDDNYEKVDDSRWLGESEDIYKVPRNVPAGTYLPGSDSEDEQPIYDVPPNRFRNAPTTVPSSSPNINEGEIDDEPVYDIPPNRHLFHTEDHSDHDYLNIPREQLLVLSMMATKMKPNETVKNDRATNDEPSSPSASYSAYQLQSTEQKKRSHTVAECENLTVTDTSNVNEPYDEHVYDDLDSALSETLLLIQTMAKDEDEPIYDDAITPAEQSVTYKPTDTTRINSELQNDSVTYSHLVPTKRKTSIPEHGDTESPVYDDALPPIPKTNAVSCTGPQHLIKKKPSKDLGYAEIMAVKNIVEDNNEQMTVTRMAASENDDVFKSPIDSSPSPKPKKRTRFLTSASPPKVSPKPKPRRLTAPLKSEGDDASPYSEKFEQILATSSQKGDIKIRESNRQPSARVEQNKTETKPVQTTKKPSYVYLELRTAHKKPPPSPPRKHSSLSTSSPGTVKKSVPPVAPKPKPKKNL